MPSNLTFHNNTQFQLVFHMRGDAVLHNIVFSRGQCSVVSEMPEVKGALSCDFKSNNYTNRCDYDVSEISKLQSLAPNVASRFSDTYRAPRVRTSERICGDVYAWINGNG